MRVLGNSKGTHIAASTTPTVFFKSYTLFEMKQLREKFKSILALGDPVDDWRM